jgi:hypothetical protein
MRKLKDEDKAGVVVFIDGTSVPSLKRVVSVVSNTLYFETTKETKAPHGKAYMVTRDSLLAWAVPISMVKGVK